MTEWEMLNGHRVVAGWGASLRRAQTFQANLRVKWDGKVRCGDCAAEPGQLHVPYCDQERCPACRGQLISSDCGAEAKILDAWAAATEGH